MHNPRWMDQLGHLSRLLSDVRHHPGKRKVRLRDASWLLTNLSPVSRFSLAFLFARLLTQPMAHWAANESLGPGPCTGKQSATVADAIFPLHHSPVMSDTDTTGPKGIGFQHPSSHRSPPNPSLSSPQSFNPPHPRKCFDRAGTYPHISLCCPDGKACTVRYTTRLPI